jgi:hypothetical protein
LTNQGKIMHRHEMQQSNIYLGIYIIGYYFFWKNQGVTQSLPTSTRALATAAVIQQVIDAQL